MWETSKREDWVRQWIVESMIESLYWMGIDHPANGTILPAGAGGQGLRIGGATLTPGQRR